MGRLATIFAVVGLNGVAWSAPATLTLTKQFAAPGTGVELGYSPQAQELFLRNSASAIRVIDASTGTQTGLQLANYAFSGLSVSPSGNYVYAADYGGTNTGYGTPLHTNYVHRYDVQANSWQVLAAPNIAYRIKAIDDNTFLLDEEDQFVHITLNTFGASSITQTASTSGDTESNFAYDPSTGRVLYGNSGSSSQEIFAARLVNGQFVQQESSGGYGSAQGYGGTDVLSLDNKYFYYGKLQVDALDVSANLRVFPQAIIASGDGIAFGATSYYNADTGALLGSYGFTAQSIALNPDGSDMWALGKNNQLYHYALTPEPTSMAAFVTGAGLLVRRRKRG